MYCKYGPQNHAKRNMRSITGIIQHRRDCFANRTPIWGKSCFTTVTTVGFAYRMPSRGNFTTEWSRLKNAYVSNNKKKHVLCRKVLIQHRHDGFAYSMHSFSQRPRKSQPAIVFPWTWVILCSAFMQYVVTQCAYFSMPLFCCISISISDSPS